MDGLYQTDYRETEAKLPPPADPRNNILAALERGLPEFVPSFIKHDGSMAVCAAGPSMPKFIEDVRKEREARRPIMAIKGAHDLLCDAGIEPDIFVSCEAKPRLDNVQHRNAHTLYLLSSRCSPELFDWLKDCKVLVWHPYTDPVKERPMPELSGYRLIGGGTTSGLRGVTLGYLMGFARFTLYGFDSCLDPSKRKRFNSEKPMQPEQIVDRIVRGRRFLCNYAMAMQADECQMYYKLFPDIHFDVKGDGLIAAIMEDRKRRGLRV